ncbi:helicase [Ktedonosporobacter rubrisoli]|uniref:Helicase n=1 Tax=Ktedonosporobacter rubrisoli TaxID=2509675 RepID=A0A4P6JYD6_KTERU|nr:helicase [Ktedonosporobacter rubrisoli]QBD80737.1 helicase [Ktedonosporobacter rubrisoli]
METAGEQRNTLGEHLGRIFEIGFNTGFLAAINQHKQVKTRFGELYKNDLSQLKIQHILGALYQLTGLINPLEKEILRRWVLYFFQKGYLAGLNLFTEFLDSFAQQRKNIPREIVYLQCNFYGQNSLYTYNKNDKAAIEALMQQFQGSAPAPLILSEEEMRQHQQKGNFLKADTLLLLKYSHYWRILCIDLSVFSVRHLEDANDLSNIENIRHMLASELYYNRSRSAFSDMSIDTEKEDFTNGLLSNQLKHYFTAFKRRDKETAKLIQAASYAHDFYNFLVRKDILKSTDKVLFNVIGYTDRAVNAMSLKQDQVNLLKTCAEIYKTHLADQAIGEVRAQVLNQIQRAARKGFGGERKFVQQLVHLVDNGDGVHWLEHTETLEDFLNTRTPITAQHLSPTLQAQLRPDEYAQKHALDVHALLTSKELENRKPYLFLTGNPGIGKTTAIVNFLKRARQRGEGFLFLYISPRKQVNLDIIKKFREDTGEPACSDTFALTSNSIIIRNNAAQKTVHYYSDLRHDTFQEQNVTFIHAESEEAQDQRISARKLEEIQEGLLIDKGERISGVLDSLCTALHITLEKPLAQAIIATVAIQSLKRLNDAKGTTLHHLDTIFKGVYNDQGKLIPHKMELLSRNIKHLFIMIDEVTGDESGVEFLHGLHTFLENRELLTSPHINTKVIVADASIVEPEIITQHLGSVTYEPDKIYFRRLGPSSAQAYPLHAESFHFLKEPATVINANTFPASKLHLSYKIGVDALQFDPNTFLQRSKQLEQATKARIITDIITGLDKENIAQQLVYIQDKQRLSELILDIRKARGKFEYKTDYLEIHANISEQDKQDIDEYRKTTRVVFMTASASRGLSFPQATRILIDIPHFEIEQNLMEILQVIYRGRGGERDQEEKQIIFYLTDQIIYTEAADREQAVREGMVRLLNVLLILKTSMMTRISGSLQLGINQHFMMVPIGGKSVYSAGETFTSRISNLIREAQTLARRHYGDKRLKVVQESLMSILEHVRISLRPLSLKPASGELKRENYIAQIPRFAYDFEQRLRRGFDQLLTLPPLERAYINGSLLVVPIVNMSMQEAYWMQFERVWKENQAQSIDLLKMMRDLSGDKQYPPSFQMALKDGIALIKALQEMAENKIPHYEQESHHPDQHYVLPLVTFLTQQEMREHFAGDPEPNDADNPLQLPFHTLLERYVRTLYSADSMLPIGKQYDDFPFLVFRSLNVKEARSRMFTGKYLFMSQELNILNMLLSSTPD